MGTIHCPGGHTFSYGLVPCPHQSLLISEEQLEPALNEIEQIDWTREFAGDGLDWILRSRGHVAYRCPHCARLLIFEQGLDKPATSYRQE